MDNIRIIQADHSHAPLLSWLGKETFYEWFTAGNNFDDVRDYAESAFTVEQMHKELGETGTLFLVAFDGEVPAGYAKLRLSAEVEIPGKKSIELHRLYATREYIGKKIGSLLMKHALDEARSKGYNIVWLGVWEKNDRAISFYKKWEFEKFSSHSFMLGKDKQTDLLMKREV